MLEFVVLKNESELEKLNNWEISLSSKRDKKLFNEEREEVLSSYAGRQYRLYKRGHHNCPWEKFALSLLVICTLGIALSSKYVCNALFKGRVTKNFAVCINNISPQSAKHPEKESQSLSAMTKEQPVEPSLQIVPTTAKNQSPSAVEAKKNFSKADLYEKLYGAERFIYYLGGQENFEKLPTLDLAALGTIKIYIGNGQYIDRPAWAPLDYPDSISLTALEDINSDFIRGVNGLPGYEYLIVKYKDFYNSPGIFVFFSHNDNGHYGGCKIHGGGCATDLDSLMSDHLTYEVNDHNDSRNTRKLTSREKLRELFTKGTITGTNENYRNPVTACLKSRASEMVKV